MRNGVVGQSLVGEAKVQDRVMARVDEFIADQLDDLGGQISNGNFL